VKRGANLGRDERQKRASLLQKTQELDSRANSMDIDDEGWIFRFHLEDQLMNCFQVEEEY
jgi:hypothetical protein